MLTGPAPVDAVSAGADGVGADALSRAATGATTGATTGVGATARAELDAVTGSAADAEGCSS
ncbi:MAG: hypothetical protein WAX29_08455 [Propionibacterium sp.]